MRVLSLSLAVLALLAGFVLLIGQVTPATRDGRATIAIAASPWWVLAATTNVEAQPEWRDMAVVMRTGDGSVEVTARVEG